MGLLVAERIDRRTCWGETAWIHLLEGNDVGVAVGLLLGHRSCTVVAAGLAIARVRTVCRGRDLSIRLMKGLKGALLRWLLAWTVMSSAISSSSLSGVSSSKITNGLLLRVCR